MIATSARADVRRRARLAVGRAASFRHVYPPDFVIAGVQRGGTTSFYKYLSRHPSVGPSVEKEIHFFDDNFHRGTAWYRAHFPSRREAKRIARTSGERMVTGEASPYYLFDPRCARRMAEHLPDVKTIILLRDPVRRAFSHYCLTVGHGREHLSFEDAIAAEPERLRGEAERVRADPTYRSANLHHFSYVSRGMYAEQLERWFAFFSPESVLILRSEDLFGDTEGTLRRAFAFLGLAPATFDEYRRHNVRSSRPGPAIEPATEALLRERFREPNERLRALLGTDPGW